MGHVVVRRIAVALCALLGAAALGFGWLTSRRPAPPAAAAATDGRAAFTRHCAGCHDAAALRAAIAAAPDAAAPAPRLLALLASHGDASDAEDRAIVVFLSAGEGG